MAKVQHYETQYDKLKHCPFCGTAPVWYRKGNEQTKSQKIVITCPHCHIIMSQSVIRNSIEWLEEVMIKKWNKRIVI